MAFQFVHDVSRPLEVWRHVKKGDRPATQPSDYAHVALKDLSDTISPTGEDRAGAG